MCRETPIDPSLWKLVGAFLWVRITDRFLPSCLISNLVVVLGLLLLHLQTLYHVYSQPSLRRLLCNIAWINESSSENESIVLDSGSYVHATGNKQLLDPESIRLGQTGATVTVGNGSVLQMAGHGSINRDNLKLACVLYVPGLMVNDVSVRQLTALDYQVQFVGDEFFVREVCTDAMVGRGRLGCGMYQVEFLQVPLDRGRCLNCLYLGHIYDQS
ncbi:hypothetical protein HU200_053961 [Digitaria exilis]|uniref:Retrovirus-related Pol polyprotein from transposon TNT 1-94-like beta-barrel domain-containing protein n=1 Tax=Digitaria exilis TaxID=1010633 RepID=A0A835E5W2_9POAL|nr:hypothetical protein HU200_053961 [Digitaria exilis]